MKKFALPLLIAVMLQSFIAVGQEPLHNQKTDSLFMAGGMLNVPQSMYGLITTWALLDEKERTQDLATYLYQNYMSQELVSDFLSLYQSGFNGTGSANKTTSGTCVCKTLRPYPKYNYWSEDIIPIKDVNNGWKNIHKTWNGGTNYSFHMYNQGPAMNMSLRVGGDDGAADWSIAKEDGILVFEFMNLCTEAYLINSECNCDKFLEADAKYMHSYNYEGSASTFISAKGYWGRLSMGVGAFSFDRTSLGLTTLNTNNLQMNVYLKQSKWEFQLNPNFEGLLKVASAMVKLVTDLKEVSANLGTLATAVQSAGSQPDGYQDPTPVNHQTLLGGTLTLKANIPKVVTYVSVARLATGGMGTKFASQLDFDSFFWVAFKIPNTTSGFGPNNTQIDDVCCNESYGSWWMSKNFASPAYDYTKEKNEVLAILDGNSQAYNLYRWHNAIQLYKNVPASNYPAMIDINDPNNTFLVRLDTNYGALESIDYCGCEDLKTSSSGINVQLARPEIFAQHQSYCGTPFALTNVNHNSVDLNKIQIDWYFKATSSSTNLGNPIPGSTNSPSIMVNSPGIYSVVYTALSSLDCQSIDYVYIPECTGKWNSEGIGSGFSFTVSPNPAKEVIVLSSNTAINEAVSYYIVNSLGAVVNRGEINQREQLINVAEYPEGVYLVIIQNH